MSHRIRILSMSDVHGTVFPHSYADGTPFNGGYAKLKSLIDFLRDDHTVVIDNGDTIQGNPMMFFHYLKHPDRPCPASVALREIGVDFVNIGNHDFNEGPEALLAHLAESGATCITSNVTRHGKPMAQPYVMRSLGGKLVAFFGVVTQHVPHWEPERHLTDIGFTDAFETVQATVSALRALPRKERPDYIICVYHGGFERDPATGALMGEDSGENEGYRIITETEGLDILITGHQHIAIKGESHGTVYSQPGTKGAYLSVIDIDTLSGKIKARLITPDEDADEDMLALFAEEEKACQQWLDTPLGETKDDFLIRDEFEARLHKSQVVTYLNHVQAGATGAELSATSLFSGATGFGKEITMRDLVSTYVFTNTLVVKQITGSVLRAYLEKTSLYWTLSAEGEIIVSEEFIGPSEAHFNYDMVDGVEYTIRVSNPPGERITELTRNGKPVRDDDVFTLVINNYRAAGGGEYDMLSSAKTVSENLTDMVELLANDILKNGEIDFEPADNIRVVV